MGRGPCVLLAAGIALMLAAGVCGAAEEVREPEAEMEAKSAYEKAVERLSVSVYADVETAYWARGKIVDKNPYSAQYAGLEYDLAPFGRIGGNAWSVCSMSRDGQGANRQNFFNEVDYIAYYGYALEIAEGWALDTFTGPKWVTLPGYHPHAATVYEWVLGQQLTNPFVTPYYLMRRAYYQGEWCYWNVGLKRAWEICDSLTLTAILFGDMGNSRHFRSQYGANPNDPRGDYSNGLMALNLLIRLDYAITDYLGLFAFVHQFDVVSGDARDALDADTSPESLKDLTIFGIGFTLKF